MMNSSSAPARSRTSFADVGRRVKQILLDTDKIPFYLWLALAMTFLIECLSRRSVVDAAVFMTHSPLAFLTNYGIILLTLLPSLLLPKRTAGIALFSSIWLLLGVAQCIVLMCRVTPLTAVDIAIVFSVITVVTAYVTPFQLVLILLGIAALIAGIVILFIKTKRTPVRWKYFLICFLITLAVFALVMSAGFAAEQLSDHFPNLANAHNDYGFPYCFIMSIVDRGVDKPDSYGEGMITDILDDMPPAGPVVPEKKPNVVIVQLESFFDVKHLKGVTFSSDPTPNFTALKEQFPSGLLTVPVIGAGTVNTEFEILSGMRIADFGAGEYPYRSVMKTKTCETIAYDLLASGYRTHALHNHEGTFYQRNEVYKHLGFQSFTPIEYFENPTFNENNWAHDRLLTKEILNLMDGTDESDFVFAVSVQGHGKYMSDYVPAPGDVQITGGFEGYEETKARYNYFISQINEMDAFVGELYEALMTRDEETVLVLYGDHLPSIARSEGVEFEDMTEFDTEYIIVSNFTPEHPLEDRPLHAYQVFPTVMGMIGNNEGVMNRFHRTYAGSENYLTLLHDLTYDCLYGDRLAYGQTVYPPIDDMAMGTFPIEVHSAYADGDYLYIKGDHFTAYSTVCLDGSKKKTEFIDTRTLRIKRPDDDWFRHTDCRVTIRQLSGRGEFLSETPAFSIHPHSIIEAT